MTTLIEKLASFSARPTFGSEEYKCWIDQADFIAFLSLVDTLDEIVLYASGSHLFLHGVLVPTELVSPPDKEDLDGWNCEPFSSWGITVSFGGGGDAYISPPLDNARSRTIEHGEQLVFARSFDGRQQDRSYIECSQRLTHSFDLHYVPERSAYCRFDSRGDVEDVMRIMDLTDKDRDTGRAVTIARQVLDEYMVLTGQSFVLMFDSTRFTPSNFGGWRNRSAEYHELSADIFHRIGRSKGSASYIRGTAVVRSRLSLSDVLRRHGFGTPEEREYASFITYDWKHDVIRECASDPAELGNYFVKSDLPFETSPAFFRADVLLKYKADPDKYEIRERSITCRHVWHLQSYDINEAGQVHTYLIYLSRLPYDEQLYWKSFNEKPKAPIAKRAYKSDFLGEYVLDYDPLPSLKHQLHELDGKCVGWWILRSEELLDRVHYPVTAAAEEWGRELHALDKLLIEGFELKALRKIAEAQDVTMIDASWGSLKLIEEVLSVLGCDEEPRNEILGPLRELHRLRSKVSGHASGREALAIKASILRSHKSYRVHFRALCAKCDHAVAKLTKLLVGAGRGPI